MRSDFHGLTDDEIFTAIADGHWCRGDDLSISLRDSIPAQRDALSFIAWFYLTARQYGGVERFLLAVLLSQVVWSDFFSDSVHGRHVDMLLALPVRAVGYLVRAQPDW